MHRPIPCACGQMPRLETSIDEHSRSVDITCYRCGQNMEESHSSGPDVELSTLTSHAMEGWAKKVTAALRTQVDQQVAQVKSYREEVRTAHQALDILGIKFDPDNVSISHRIKPLVEQRDSAIARAVAATAERDRARADLESMTISCKQHAEATLRIGAERDSWKTSSQIETERANAAKAEAARCQKLAEQAASELKRLRTMSPKAIARESRLRRAP